MFKELRRQAGWHEVPTAFFHFRDRDGVEVDLVLDRGAAGTVAGVEVKASATVTASDFRGLRKLASAAGVRFAGGVVLYDGETTARFGDRLHAVPSRAFGRTVPRVVLAHTRRTPQPLRLFHWQVSRKTGRFWRLVTRRKLPIGIQTFREIREEDCYYVDKTGHARRLAERGKHYFLSRPRRFGKSLFLDTLKELFEGNEPLFRGLEIHDHWDWSRRHPVLRLSFGTGKFTEPGQLHTNAMAQLAAVEGRAGVGSTHATAPERLGHLIEALHERAGQRVVVLVDEYDKPILDALRMPEVARAHRDYLHGAYSTIKDRDAHIRFTFLTGISRSPQRGSARGNPSWETASKVSLFSGLNNLQDITLDPRYSTVCGYTDADLDAVFAPELPGLDRAEIRDWYNGYNWRGEERVYNPFDILLLFERREFRAWWFETGTPTFLIETLLARGVGSLDLDGMLGSEELLSAARSSTGSATRTARSGRA